MPGLYVQRYQSVAIGTTTNIEAVDYHAFANIRNNSLMCSTKGGIF